MKGKLYDQPLAELIREISSKSLSGTLRLEHERAKAAVYFDAGRVIFAASNLRTLRLVEYLTRQALVTEKELAALGKNVSDLQVAATLGVTGKLNQAQVDGLLTTQVSDVLKVALLWTGGTWEFDGRAHLDDPVRVSVNTSDLLREAAHRLPLNFVTLRFRNLNEEFSRTPRALEVEQLLPAESFLLSRLDVPTKLADLVALSGLHELEAHRMIYGLALSGCLDREYWQNAFRAQVVAATVLHPAPSEVAPPPLKEVSAVDQEADLEGFLDRLSRANDYYGVLEVEPTAETNQIKEAYYGLARRYHPDRFHLRSGTSMHARISSAFARITQAYESLIDPIRRSNYDLTLERSKQFAASAPRSKTGPLTEGAEDSEIMVGSVRAEHNFQEGFGALQQGRFKEAVNLLAAAARAVPNEARYRAYYGKALAAGEKTRRLAEAELQAAIRSEPSNADYRTMLAELYLELKFFRRAHTELERALALDPNNIAASLLRRKLDKSRKIG